MCFFFFLCIYLLNTVKALKSTNHPKKCLNILVSNEDIYKKKLLRRNLSLFRNGINFYFWKKKYHERSIEEKLNVIPVYILTNYNNSPYIFQENDKQVCYLFLCPHDAESMLNEITKNNSIKNISNIKIHSISMEKAYNLIKEFLLLKTMEKKNEDIKKNNIYWKLIPSKKQIQNALIFLSFKKKSDLIFPVFYVEGLYIHRDSKNIIPLFFDLEDLKKTIEEKFEKSSLKNYKIKVLNFVDLIFSFRIVTLKYNLLFIYLLPSFTFYTLSITYILFYH
ncbi:apicoplast TIC22 precursor, putative [Plasmodium gallinaceum]|uniref:Apicoplast TIC22, putative n=1 Tax=Plasmodium gallinaceum TaxID=5849 RepID=A0A1J1GL51_PLAGA|nr:apicoplast TIC22 precursor, putative [Plasmodium gallinaceum]CRG93060.1 apicoplast TIC22 precursor, putative [Plasmodium gallinaceum]